MTKDHKPKGILKYVKINDTIDDEASLSSAIEEDDELIKLVYEREHQDEIKVNIPHKCRLISYYEH
jgi:hypothetical protein